MAPEIKLLFQLASSGIMIHMTNTMFKSALPVELCNLQRFACVLEYSSESMAAPGSENRERKPLALAES